MLMDEPDPAISTRPSISLGVQAGTVKRADAGRQVAPTPVISVVMPVFNEQSHLDDQLDALSAQDIKGPWKVVISDNGSTDDTRDLVLARRSAFPVRLRLVDSTARRGAAHARNAGILAARAPLIAFCDGDDVVSRAWLSSALRGLADHDVVGGPLRRLVEPFDPHSARLPYTSIADDSIMTCSVALRREVLERAGGFDATFSGYGREDHELSVRLWKVGARFGHEEGMEAHYRLEPNQWTFTRKIYLSAIADTRVWKRHPDVFPGRQSRGYVIREALALPVNALRSLHAGGPRRLARTVVWLLAHARSLLPAQRPLGSPILLGDTVGALEVI